MIENIETVDWIASCNFRGIDGHWLITYKNGTQSRMNCDEFAPIGKKLDEIRKERYRKFISGCKE